MILIFFLLFTDIYIIKEEDRLISGKSTLLSMKFYFIILFLSFCTRKFV